LGCIWSRLVAVAFTLSANKKWQIWSRL